MRVGGLELVVDERPGYLFVIEEGSIGTGTERYLAALERLGMQSGRQRLLIDARARLDPLEDDVVWAWFGRQSRFAKLAFVFEDELTVAECNMKALAQGLPVRCFNQVQLAQRWLFRERRRSTSSLPPSSEGSGAP